MTQTKRDTLVLLVRGCVLGLRIPPHKILLQNLQKKSQIPLVLLLLLLKMVIAVFTVSFYWLKPHGHHLRQVVKYL